MSFKKFKTEKMLLASIGVLALFLFASAFSKELGTNVSMAEEESGASSPSSNGASSNEDSQDNEDSQKENSQDDEQSEPSTPSVKRTQTTQRAQTTQKTQAVNTEGSEKSSDEVSQQSISPEKEASEASVPSEKSQEVSEESIKYIEGYGDIVSKEGNVMLVKKDEKLFFLIPVEVESQVTLDEQGSVVDAKKSFLNWLLSVFSL